MRIPRICFATATALLTLGLTAAPAHAAEARQQPAAPPQRAAVAAPPPFNVWFNGYGSSPKADLVQGGHQVALHANCDSDIVAAQLYHVTWGRDRPVGNVVRIPCNGGTSAYYNLSGGEYYFYFLSGVDNTQVVGTWA
ncbi:MULTISPECIES: hypothetical protein [Streptomyces]|uniref:Uncharacterized protein n=2 Tax=Streptomyces TaxID=1883 RepID=A0A0W7X7W4_9ACTN|nr:MULTISPECIES: hypothetical protein [Streptomyces]KUF18959.1 hypothetical protein AT728_08045 [Streptomyces silvensis]MVO89500.1 hypothetical protein [Streptomyces typhae]